MQQNETIRINIQIDDRTVRDLDRTISNLYQSLNDLDRNLGNSVSTVQNTVNEFNLLGKGIETVLGTFSVLESTIRFLTIDFKQAKRGINMLLGITNDFSNATETANSKLQTKAKTTDSLSKATKQNIQSIEISKRSLLIKKGKIIDLNKKILAKKAITSLATDANNKLATSTKQAGTAADIQATSSDVVAKSLATKTAASKIATGATKALGFAMKAIPFLGAISLATSLWRTFGNLFSGTNEVNDATDDFADSLANLRNQLADNRDAHDSNIRSISAYNKTMGNLVDTVLDLNSRSNLTADEYNQLRIATDLLNDSTSGYALTIDDATGRLDENGVEVALSMARYHDLASATEKVEENLVRLSDLYNDKNYAAERVETLEEAHKNLNNQLTEYRNQLKPYQEELAEINRRMGHYNILSDEANKRQQYLRDSINEIEESMSYLDEQIDSTSNELEGYRMVLSDAEEDIVSIEETLVEAYQTMDSATTDYVSNQILSWDSLNVQQQEVVNQLVDRWAEYRDNSREMFNRVIDDTQLWGYHTNEAGEKVQGSFRASEATHTEVVQSMIDNMRANREATAEWSDNLDELAYRTSEEFAEHMRSMGVESADIVAAMLSDCHELLYELADEFEMGGYAATDNIARSLGEGGEELVMLVDGLGGDLGTTLSQSIIDADFESIGLMLPEGLTRGVEDGTDGCIEAVSNMSTGMSEAFESLNDISSPSGRYMEYGNNIVEGLSEGISSLKDQPKNKLQSLATAMKAIYDTAHSDYQSIGQTMMDGLNAGLLGREHMLMGTARRIASQIRQTINNAINQTSSPSPSFAGAPSTGITAAPAMLSNIDTGYAQKLLHNSYHGFSPAFTNQPPVSSLVRNINHTTTHHNHNANSVTLNMGSTNPEYAFTRTNRYLRNLK